MLFSDMLMVSDNHEPVCNAQLYPGTIYSTTVLHEVMCRIATEWTVFIYDYCTDFDLASPTKSILLHLLPL